MRGSPVRAPAVAAAVVLAVLSGAPAVQAQGAPIFTCMVGSKKVTSDRVIAKCDGEQRELNHDGSLRRIVPPPLTADERAAEEAREAERALELANKREAIRRDRNLLMRFPNEAAHRKAREAALEDTRKSLRTSEARLELLEKERKPLMDESEFYVGKPLPIKLKQQIEGNQATTDAQRTLVLGQQAELVRINNLYDVELERLRKLWSGAPAGSLGVLPVPPPVSAPSRKPLP